MAELDLDAQLSASVAMRTERDTNHVWKLVRSSMLVNVLPQEHLEVEVAHSSWKSLKADDSDVVLLVQQYLHSTRMSLKPLLVQPREVALKLQWGHLRPARRNMLGERLLQECRKTAELVGCQPWNLLKARNYLEKLCDNNQSGLVPHPPVLDVIRLYQIKGHCPRVPDGEWRPGSARKGVGGDPRACRAAQACQASGRSRTLLGRKRRRRAPPSGRAPPKVSGLSSPPLPQTQGGHHQKG